MNIPKQIYKVRTELGESQSQFGERFGLSQAAISDYENGKSEAGYAVLKFVLREYLPQECPHCNGLGFMMNRDVV